MEVVITAIIISIAVSLVTTVFVTLVSCYGFKIYIEKEVNRILDEEGLRTEAHVLEMIAQAKESIRDAYFNK